ncbi:amidase [Paraburkholderia strydomiana]|uniref:amidase n=1 Tax=Paraburkholderia strydomiana TaxID=1245417 RepID=UPI00285700F8|nr:amidase family protein [Paraburkholderia strydomiana]MDR7009639.1 amidase [Paraburkholderia strydomiana]
MTVTFCPLEKNLAEIASALDSGATSSVELVRYYQRRIAELDHAGPRVNAVSTLTAGALDDAAALDRERATHGARGRLHGVPLLVKDNIDVAGLTTTAGSVALERCLPERDADVVAALRRAGAIVLGKTNMSEFASSNGRPGYSSAAGLTVNPYDLGRDASGSSSGSAAAVTTCFAAAALGTDTFGSVRGPASVTGIAALRPTHGLLSCNGVVPLASIFDTVGPMSRWVEDLPLLMNALVACENTAHHAQPVVRPTHVSYREALDASAIKDARIGVLDGLPVGHPDVASTFNSAIATLRAAGAIIERVTLSTDLATLMRDTLAPLAGAQFAAEIARYLEKCPADSPKSLSDIIARLAAHDSATNGRDVNPATFEKLLYPALQLAQLDATVLAALIQRLEAFRASVRDWFDGGISALFFPTHLSVAAPRFDQFNPSALQFDGNPMVPSYLATAAGLPELTMPAGFCRGGLPIGVSFVGAPFAEQTLMDLSYSFQTRQNARVAPSLTECPASPAIPG